MMLRGLLLLAFHTSSSALAVAAKAEPKKPRIDVLGLSAHAAATVGASFEFLEDISGIGHRHGLCLLLGSKICREINMLRENTVGAAEATGVVQLAGAAWKVLTSKVAAATLSSLALFAAVMEVMEDLSPGGHHGAVLLATNELFELLGTSGVVSGRVQEFLEGRTLRLALLLGAVAAALIEVLGPGARLGAHHGVAVLAIAKVIQTVGMLRDQWRVKAE